MRSLFIKFIILLLSLVFIQACSSKKVTLVEVDKSDRKMYLKKHGKVVKKYNIALGLNPRGRKLREGDNKTPEGVYVLDYKNRKSKFYRSIHISYPNYLDRLRAKSINARPGGAIVIHGMPNGVSQKSIIKQRGRDWTNGCIALKNSDMREVWSLVRTNAPIYIKP